MSRMSVLKHAINTVRAGLVMRIFWALIELMM